MPYLNWVDVLIILILLRSVYIGVRIGLTAEVFKLIGTLISIVVGLHYYSPIAYTLIGYVNFPAWFAEFIVLVAILFIFRTIFKYGVVLLLKILNIQFILQLERVGGGLVALCRGFFIGGLVLIALSLFPFKYIKTSVSEKSFLSPYLVTPTKKFYTSIIRFIPSQQPRGIAAGPAAKQSE